ncbi:MAG: hypothetical protein KY446_10300 [Proteobacteria bacterium]|nr:hypothetical protein [Pseudomonadota bacterium]MBW3618118.1 hypothetical protein [Pseudomonadota bacterium]
MRKIAALLLAMWVSSCSAACRNDPVATADAPTGELKAVLFQRDCGATTGFSSQVSLTNDGALSAGGNVFIADTNHEAASAASWGGPWVELRWLSPKHLLVRYDADARVFAQNQNVSGVDVSYEKVAR